MSAVLHPSIIERCPRSVRLPNRTITAPQPVLARAFTDEDVRLACFEQSRATVGGVVAPLELPA